MTLWTRVRDGVLARVREGGRQVALALAEALRDRVAAGRVVLVVGSWRQAFEALGVPAPRCAKTAIRALTLLAELAGGAVQRLGARGHRWVVSSAGALQLDLDLERDGKPESGPDGTQPASQPASPAPRTPARSLALDRSQRSLAAAELADRVTATGALERGEAFAVTLTVAEGVDAAAVAEAFGRELAAAGGGAVLVPEVAEHLHHHGVAIGTAEQVDAALRACGAGHSMVTPISDLRRWTGYVCKRWTGEELASGVLAEDGMRDGGRGEASGAGDRGEGAAADVERPAPRSDGGHGQREDHERGGAGRATGRRALGEGTARARAASWTKRVLGAAWRWVMGRARR